MSSPIPIEPEAKETVIPGLDRSSCSINLKDAYRSVKPEESSPGRGTYPLLHEWDATKPLTRFQVQLIRGAFPGIFDTYVRTHPSWKKFQYEALDLQVNSEMEKDGDADLPAYQSELHRGDKKVMFTFKQVILEESIKDFKADCVALVNHAFGELTTPLPESPQLLLTRFYDAISKVNAKVAALITGTPENKELKRYAFYYIDPYVTKDACVARVRCYVLDDLPERVDFWREWM